MIAFHRVADVRAESKKSNSEQTVHLSLLGPIVQDRLNSRGTLIDAIYLKVQLIYIIWVQIDRNFNTNFRANSHTLVFSLPN